MNFKWYLYFLIIQLLGLFTVLAVVFSSVSYNAIGVPFNIQKYSNEFLGQGWAFFTLNPRMEYFDMYKVVDLDHDVLEHVDLKFSSLRNGMGVSRNSRVTNIEAENILSEIDSTQWTVCKTQSELKTNEKAIRPILVFDNATENTFSGLYLVVKTSPLPWAWYMNKEKIFMPKKIVKIYVR